MITTTCKPLNARWWFNLRTPINLMGVFGGFALLVFVLQHFINPLIGDAISIGIAFCVYFFVLDTLKRGQNQVENHYCP